MQLKWCRQGSESGNYRNEGKLLDSSLGHFWDFKGTVMQDFYFFKYFIYLFMRDTEREREAETQAEGEAGSMQGA